MVSPASFTYTETTRTCNCRTCTPILPLLTISHLALSHITWHRYIPAQPMPGKHSGYKVDLWHTTAQTVA